MSFYVQTAENSSNYNWVSLSDQNIFSKILLIPFLSNTLRILFKWKLIDSPWAQRVATKKGASIVSINAFSALFHSDYSIQWRHNGKNNPDRLFLLCLHKLVYKLLVHELNTLELSKVKIRNENFIKTILFLLSVLQGASRFGWPLS